MNASGLGLAALLLVVLLVVVFGVQEMDTAQQNQIQQLMQQRDQTVALAQEAKTQRDDKASEAALLKGQLGDMKAGLQAKEAELATKSTQLEEASRLASEQTARIQSLEAQNAGLQQQVQIEQARSQERDKLILAMNGQLEAASKANSEQLARLQALEGQIPVTSGNEQAATECQNVSANGFINPLGPVLVVLIGMLALGSTGYVLYQEKKHVVGW